VSIESPLLHRIGGQPPAKSEHHRHAAWLSLPRLLHVRSFIGAFAKVGLSLGYFEDLPDARQSGKVRYPLSEVPLLCLVAVLSGAEIFTDIANFGARKLAFLRRFRPFAGGTPSHDHLGDILATLDADGFQRCFVAWVASLTGVASDVIAIDGKTVRRSKGAKALLS